MSEHIQIEQGSFGDFQITATGRAGEATFTLDLADVESLSNGELDASEATARATVELLLQRQDVADLPPVVDFDEIVAAYPEAVQQIVARRP